MITDSASLFEILRERPGVYYDNPQTQQRLMDDLLKWKRGEKYWCEHMLQLEVYEKGNPQPIKVWRHFVQAEGWRFYAGQEFKFCPECGARRPE